jgi:hypothetical protein
MFKNYVRGNNIGFSRSLLAAGMLLTILFNNISLLLPRGYLQSSALSPIGKSVNFFLLLGQRHILIMQAAAIIILLIVISGYFMQLTCFLHFWIAASFYFFRPLNVGGDSINMLLTLLLIPVCLFDPRKNHWRSVINIPKMNVRVQTIFLLAIKLQVIYIYFDAVIKKLQTPEWRNGTIIYYWFNHNFFGLDDAFTKYTTPLLTSIPILLLIAWGSIIIEALIVTGFLWSDRYKILLLKLAIIFHVVITLVLGFSSFFFAMSGGLFLYLYPSKRRFEILPFNEFFLFYAYIFIVILIANLLPVSYYTSLFDIISTLTGILILFIRTRQKLKIKAAD